MIFVRLEVKDETGITSRPFCICTQCHRIYFMGADNFCSSCGHKLIRKNKVPQIIKIDMTKDPSFNEWDINALRKVLLERIDWNV